MPTTGMRVAHRLIAPPMLLALRAAVTGRDHVPGTGGVLLAANHRSFLDHYLLAASCPRPMWYLGKRELARGLFGRFNQTMGMVPVDRGRADLSALDFIVDLLRGGEVVGVFPEGTRSPTGELFRFRSGLARIAARAGTPVLPVGLIGTAQVWPRHELPRWGPPPAGLLQVRYGPALLPPSADSGPVRRVFTEQVYEHVAALCGQPLANRFAPIDEN